MPGAKGRVSSTHQHVYTEQERTDGAVEDGLVGLVAVNELGDLQRTKAMSFPSREPLVKAN